MVTFIIGLLVGMLALVLVLLIGVKVDGERRWRNATEGQTRKQRDHARRVAGLLWEEVTGAKLLDVGLGEHEAHSYAELTFDNGKKMILATRSGTFGYTIRRPGELDWKDC